MDSIEARDRIAEAVWRRGYGAEDNGLTLEQHAARQVAKLLAEAAELWEEIKWNYQGAERDFVDAHAEIDAQVYGMGLVIDRWFKDREVWTKASLTKTSELDDVQVVLCSMSADLGHDSMAGALRKALADISRGVR